MNSLLGRFSAPSCPGPGYLRKKVKEACKIIISIINIFIITLTISSIMRSHGPYPAPIPYHWHHLPWVLIQVGVPIFTGLPKFSTLKTRSWGQSKIPGAEWLVYRLILSIPE